MPYTLADMAYQKAKELPKEDCPGLLFTESIPDNWSGDAAYDQADYRGGCGILIGNEGNGLREETTSLAQVKISIPQPGRAESLNASVAAGILMYEVVRQRRAR